MENQEIRSKSRSTCLLCGSQGTVLYSRLPDRLFSVPGSWSEMRCSNHTCGTLWLDPQPLESEIGKLYRQYYTHGDAPAAHRAKGIYLMIRQTVRWIMKNSPVGRSRDRLMLLDLGDRPPGKILEIGSGTAARLVQFQERGWSVEGQELDPVAAKNSSKATGIFVHSGPIEDLPLKDETYDVIVLNHVLEHLSDPVRTLLRARHLLKKDGLLVMATPNIRGRGFRHFGKSWLYLDVPRHLNLFTSNSLKTLATKTGFELKYSRASQAHMTASNRGSVSIEKYDRYELGTSLSLRDELKVWSLALWFWLTSFFDLDAGDDLIVHMKKVNR